MPSEPGETGVTAPGRRPGPVRIENRCHRDAGAYPQSERQPGIIRAGSSRQTGSDGGRGSGTVPDHTSCAGAVRTTVASSRENEVKGNGSTSITYRSRGRTPPLSDTARVALRVIP